MRIPAICAALLMLHGTLTGCASSVDPQHLGPQTPPASFAVDSHARPEVWGVYARLVGHRYAPPTSGFPGFEVRWSEPGKVITESSLFLEGAFIGPDLKWSRTIRPGNRPGELSMDFNGTPWLGTIEADGSVVFSAVSPRLGEYPYRIRLSSRGEMLVQNLQWVNGALSDVIYSTPYPVESTPGSAGGGGTTAQAVVGAAAGPAPEKQADASAVAKPQGPDSSESQPQPTLNAQALNRVSVAANEAAEASAAPAATLAQAGTSASSSDGDASALPPASESAAQDAQVAALMAQHQAMISELGIEEEVNAQAAEMLAQIEREQAAGRGQAPAQEEPAPAEQPAVPAAPDMLSKTVHGRVYRVSEELPEPITGTYYYEGEGEPIVSIEPGAMQSQFQPHQDPPIPISAWVVKGPDGRDLVEKGATSRYQLTLVIEYGEGGGGNYPAGSLDLLAVVVAEDLGKAFILGERVKNDLR